MNCQISITLKTSSLRDIVLMMFAGRYLILTTVFLLLGSAFQVAAQADTRTEPKVLKQPSPKPVKGTDSTGVYGSVSIKASIDKEGKVSAAEFAEGPGWSCPTVTNKAVVEFREAARQAALKASFLPAKQNNETISSSAILTYLFAKPRPEKPSGAKVDRLTQLNTTDSPGAAVVDPPNGSTAGILNGKAESLEKPIYPAGARAVRAGGTVAMRVVIDVDGTLLSAEPISGHPLLRSAARTAACKSNFAPTLLSGQPVKVAGIITYNFVP
ncbi:MAG: energy transducer TonB [Pyrinomonadaceae bacterium]